MADPTAVAVTCPLCGWTTADVAVRNEPNGVWHAFRLAAGAYHSHHDEAHSRPRPTVVLRYQHAEATP